MEFARVTLVLPCERGSGVCVDGGRRTSALGGRIIGSRRYARIFLFFARLQGDITRERPIKVSPKIRWRNMDPRTIFCSPVYPADRFDAVSVTLFGPAAAVQVSFDLFIL